jgi:hypothetical protein
MVSAIGFIAAGRTGDETRPRRVLSDGFGHRLHCGVVDVRSQHSDERALRWFSLLSSLLSCLTAVAGRSIRQVKITLYVIKRVDRLITFANPLKSGGCEVVVLKVLQAIRDEFAQVVGLVRPVWLARRSSRASDSASSRIDRPVDQQKRKRILVFLTRSYWDRVVASKVWGRRPGEWSHG